MKKNDIALIILIVAVCAVITYFIGNAIIGDQSAKQVSAEVLEPISGNITEPSKKIFNKDAINPTVVIQIGSPSNQQPFGQ